MPEEMAFHVLRVAKAKMQNRMFRLESLKSSQGAGGAGTPHWGYGPENENEAELVITEALRWLELNLQSPSCTSPSRAGAQDREKMKQTDPSFP